MILHESAEMYLETILLLSKEQDVVRSVDIANRMGYSKPTISEWMSKLSDAGFVCVEQRGNVRLTKEGADIAQRIYDRHVVLETLFKALGVDPEIATEDACRVEHYISDETFDALKRHLEEHVKKA